MYIEGNRVQEGTEYRGNNGTECLTWLNHKYSAYATTQNVMLRARYDANEEDNHIVNDKLSKYSSEA